MDFDSIRQAVGDTPVMTPEQGEIVYRHVVDHGARSILELGSAHGTSAAYMAAALDELGDGKVVTIDREGSHYDPKPEQTIARAGLERYVEIVRIPDSSYNWYLMKRIRERSDGNGNCEPMYDFCYLDGAHDWTIDGYATYLVEKLLKPGGWLLMDDLNWSCASGGLARGNRMSEEEYAEPHMRAVFDLIVRQHPSFTELVEQDGSWGWAKKDPSAPRRYKVETTRSISAIVLDRLKRASVELRSKRR
ncbi:MAG: hypothetical protein QOH76_2214 [Thermoleophilaceae bacterium]|jgi:predicted O-methyltransferase YrrM|nr:hypothetical protein [Thermoleophilaceae bacterium]